MKKLICFLFGKPYEDSKFYRFSYWFVVVFYFLSLIGAFIQSIFFGGWLSLLILAIAFPLLFRLVYQINILIHQSFFKAVNIRVIIILVILMVILPIGIFVTAFFLGDNIAINTSKTTINGDVKLSIGSLKGFYNVETIELSEKMKETISIPFEASVEAGKLDIYVEHDGETVWEQAIVSSQNGLIEFEGKEGTYDINIYTEEAKKIKLTLSLD